MMVKRAEQLARQRSVALLLIPLRWRRVACMFLLCSGCVNTEGWVVVEITDNDGVRIHEEGQCRYVVGGDPERAIYEWARPGQPPVKWVLAPLSDLVQPMPNGPVWPHVWAGDLSAGGLLAVARTTHRDSKYTGVTEIYRFADGQLVGRIESNPLGVAWSNDGRTLAILGVGGEGGDDEPVLLSLWQTEGGTIAQWEVEFNPFVELYSSYRDNLFALSWNADDSHVVVSTRRVPLNAMEPKCVVLNVVDGPVSSYGASDAFFLSADLMIVNEKGEWGGVWLMRLSGHQLEKVKHVSGQMFVAGSDPISGMYVAWHPPPPFSLKAFSLPLGFHDLSGHLPVVRTGFSIGSSLRLMRAEQLGSLLCEPATSEAPAPDGASGL